MANIPQKIYDQDNRRLVWEAVKQVAACEIESLDFGDDYYLAEDLASDIASYVVFDRDLVEEWKGYTKNQAWLYISKIIVGFIWESSRKHQKINEALAWQGVVGGESGLRFTQPRLRTLVRSGELFTLYDLFDDDTGDVETESLIRYLVSTMQRVITSWPPYELLRAYISLRKEERRYEKAAECS